MYPSDDCPQVTVSGLSSAQGCCSQEHPRDAPPGAFFFAVPAAPGAPMLSSQYSHTTLLRKGGNGLLPRERRAARAAACHFPGRAGRTQQPPTRAQPCNRAGFWGRVVNGRWRVVGGRWEGVGGRWQMAGGRCEKCGDLDMPESPVHVATPSYQCNTPAFFPVFDTVWTHKRAQMAHFCKILHGANPNAARSCDFVQQMPQSEYKVTANGCHTNFHVDSNLEPRGNNLTCERYLGALHRPRPSPSGTIADGRSHDHAAHGARREHFRDPARRRRWPSPYPLPAGEGTLSLTFRIDAQNRASPLRGAAGGGIMAIRARGYHE